jgi:AraC family transcriptional regulator, transcriptional activator of pobA
LSFLFLCNVNYVVLQSKNINFASQYKSVFFRKNYLNHLKNSHIPILSPDNYSQEIYPDSSKWEDYFYESFNVFHINTLEAYIEKSQLKELPLPPHRKTVYDFIFLTRGKIIRSKDLESIEFSDDSFFFLPASQITTLTSMSRDAQGYFCNFDLDIFNNNFYPKEFIELFPFFHHTANPIVKVDEDATKFILQILKRIEKEYKSENCNLDFVASCISTLLHEASRFTEMKSKIKETSATRIAERYRVALSKDIQEKQKISYYADLLSVTPEYLNRCVKSTFGKTSHELLDEMILLEAKVLLKQSSLNISELAFKIGKQNPSDFIRFFKTKTGLTPKEYRKQI